MGRIVYRSGYDNLALVSNEELRKCNYFCLKCFSSYIYTHVKTPDYVCRRCGYTSTIVDFRSEIESIIERREKELSKTLSIKS